jgi:hypothetical protein
MPLYLALYFAFHVWIGVTALVGAILLVSLTLLTETMTRASVKTAAQSASVRLGLLEAGRRSAEVLRAVRMIERLFARWAAVNAQYMETQRRSSDVVGGLGALSRVLRMLLQSSVLAVGVYLVINQQATGGIMIASSILTSRALAPVELAIAHWNNFSSTRQSWRRLTELISEDPADVQIDPDHYSNLAPLQSRRCRTRDRAGKIVDQFGECADRLVTAIRSGTGRTRAGWPSTAEDKRSTSSLVLRLTSVTLLAGLDEKDLGIAAMSAGVLAVTGVSTAVNLIPSELLPPTTWLTSSLLVSLVVKSLKGIGRRIANEPLVETAGYHPEPSSTLTPTRCISSFGSAVADVEAMSASERALASSRRMEMGMDGLLPLRSAEDVRCLLKERHGGAAGGWRCASVVPVQ